MDVLTLHKQRERCAYIELEMLTFLHIGFATCEAKVSAITITPRIELPELKRPGLKNSIGYEIEAMNIERHLSRQCFSM